MVVGSLAQVQPGLEHSADRQAVVTVNEKAYRDRLWCQVADLGESRFPFASAHRRDYRWRARQDENVGWMPNLEVTVVGQETVGPGPKVKWQVQLPPTVRRSCCVSTRAAGTHSKYQPHPNQW
eukprot:634532-Pleurochrysis_carterae.AAC.1